MARTILITGASSGLGAEMARQFAARGYDLALCARRLDRLEELAAQLHHDHPARRVVVRELDVTDHDRVFAVFDAFAADFATVDRVVVNAGLGGGVRLGTGGFETNRDIALTNFVGALAQTEAAMTIFRRQQSGHLVMIASVAAVRGMPKGATTYAATKAGVATLAEGLRADVYGTPIAVSVIYPGFIDSEIHGHVVADTPMMVDTETGVRAIVAAIEKKKAAAYVPPLPWAPVSVLLRHAPVPLLRKLV